MDFEEDVSWDHLLRKKTLKYYPKNLKELNLIIKKINKDSFVIKTGSSSYFDKSIGPGKYTLSLKKFDKIKLNKKKLFVEVGSGMTLNKLIRYLSKKKVTLYTIPGSGDISIGGAISANVIGKSSNKKYACFGDSVLSLKILTKNGKIKEVKKTVRKYVGSFGTYGIIISAKLRLLELESEYLVIEKKIVTSSLHLKKLFDEKYLYRYSIINPFPSKKKFGIFIGAKSNLYRDISDKELVFSKYPLILLLEFAKLFYYKIFLKVFYKIFFLLNTEKIRFSSFSNFHYKTNLYSYLPHAYHGGLVEIEILVKDINYLNKIKKFFYNTDVFPKYIIVKKQYKSKNNYFYEFSNNGYSIAMTFDNSIVNQNLNKFRSFYKSLEKNKIKINISKNSLFNESIKDYKKFKSYPDYNFKSYLISKKF